MKVLEGLLSKRISCIVVSTTYCPTHTEHWMESLRHYTFGDWMDCAVEIGPGWILSSIWRVDI